MNHNSHHRKYYRNSKTIDHIEKDSLFYLEKDVFILVDEDEYFAVSADSHIDNMYPVDKPNGLRESQNR